MISVVCVYNNKEILDNYLLKSLKKQTVNYELILIDNMQGKFKSAAKALNYGGRNAKSNYVMFVHQDVDLSSNTWLERVEKILDGLPNLGIAGVAGRSKGEAVVITNIKHGNPPKFAGKIQFEKPTKVQTVDECLTIIPKSVFNKLRFDEKVCNDWHLYSVDYSLSVKRLGYNVYVIPKYIYHLSSGFKPIGKLERTLRGPLQRSYYLSLKKVLYKHKNYYEKIYTTCGIYKTTYPLCLQRAQSIIKNKFTLLLKKNMIKKV